MSQSSTVIPAPASGIGPTFHWWRVAIPVLVTLALGRTAAARRPRAARMAVFRHLRRRDCRPGDRTAAQPCGRSHRPVADRTTVAVYAVCASGPRQAGLQGGRPDHKLGAVRLCQHHRLAGRRSVHVRSRLSEDGAGKAHRAPPGARSGPQHAAGRLCHDAGRRRAGAVHALQYRTQRRHPVPHRQQPAVALRLAAERCVVATVRRLHHVDDVRRRLRDQFAVHDGLRAQLPGDRVHRQDRACAHQLPAVDEGLAAVRTAAAAGTAAARLCAVSARGQAQHRGDHMGGKRTAQDGRDFDARDHTGGARDRCDRALGYRRQLHRPHADRAGGHRIDAGVRRRVLGRHGEEPFRLDHPRAARNAGDVG